ncbi:MAG: glycosyltransferase [Ruminococcus sp.]|nr:glycosyltransferase [Ruminococcus sp.]
MQILYFGTVCDIENYEKFIIHSKRKPSMAPIVFETSLLTGFKELDCNVDIYSFPMIPNFTQSRILSWGSREEFLSCGYVNKWIPTINLPFLKQISRFFNSRRIIKKWINAHNDEDCAVIIYSVCPYIAPNIINLCNKYNIKCFSIIADLPKNMFINKKQGKFKTMISNFYLKPAVKYQSRFDGYVFLTEHMKNVIGSDALYTVVEGIVCNQEKNNSKQRINKYSKKAIMYAGGLNEKYGIENLIKAFLKINREDCELWLFGDGNFVDKIKLYASKNSLIKFFGRVNHDEILEYEKKATLLVNVRNVDDEYTKYSFPSKTIEYMLSGTPVLTTKLPGIPKEYYNYLYMIENNSIDEISFALTRILDLNCDILTEFGINAKNFILDNKNASIQSEKVLKLIDKVKQEG